MEAREPHAAAVVETHSAVLVFAGDRVYKVKKAVRLPFLDFSTYERRFAACHREVELNRRLSPDVYLGVATLSEPDDPRVPAEAVVVMRRLPPERSLAALVADRDRRAHTCVRAVARAMAAFHAAADRSPAVRARSSPSALRSLWHANVQEMSATVAALGSGLLVRSVHLEEIGSLADGFLDGRATLFRQRIDAGFVCDGHGDLQAADIYCLDDGPRILDCLEFDDVLRTVDVADDVAFLAMDLERLGAPDLGRALVEAYAEFAGHPLPPALVHHYVAYRAGVRAKVTMLRAHQQSSDGDLAGAERSAGEAKRLVEMCVEHLRRGEVRMVLVGGLPGTGKSTLCEAISARHGWTVVRSDVVRKQRAGLDPTSRAPAAFGEGLYDASTTDEVYHELLREAAVLLSMGESVVLDASWSSERHRELARRVAREGRGRLVELRCVLPTEVAQERIARRAAMASDASDATTEVAGRLAAVADPWPVSREVRTDQPPDELVDRLDDVL